MSVLTEIPWLLPAVGASAVCLLASLALPRLLKRSANGENEAQSLAQAGGGWLYLAPGKGTLLSESTLPTLLHASKSLKKWNDLEALLDDKSLTTLRDVMVSAKEGLPLTPFRMRTIQNQFLSCYPANPASAELLAILVMDNTEQQRQHMMLQSETEAMKEDVQRFSAIMNNALIPCWVRDARGVIQYCNLAYTKAVEDIQSDDNIGVPELYKEMPELSRRARETGDEQERRVHIIIGGQRRLYHLHEVFITEMDATIGYAYDNHSLEQAEDEIKSYQTAQEDLLESTTSAIAVFGADTRLKYFNQAYVRMWDFDEEKLDEGPTFGEIIEWLRAKRMLTEQANFQAYKQHRLRLFTDILEPEEELHFTPDGRTIRSVTIPHALGGIIVSYEDVTDRLALERSYNTLIAVQRETLDNLHEGVVVFGEDGRVQLKNPEFATIWGFSEAETSERTHLNDIMAKICQHLPDKHWEDYRKTFTGKIQSRSLLASSWERTDGRVVDWTMVPLPDGATLLTFTDVTDSRLVERSLREKNEALQAADRLKTEFLANVSYELRSPLTSISGFSEMLRQNYFGELTEQQREYVEGIHNSAQHLSRLITDILDLASIEAGYLSLQENEFDTFEMLRGIRSLLLERSKESDLIIEIACSPDIGSMKADETRLRQVMFHLLSNAVKYSKSGTITLGAERQPEAMHLWVKDEGMGIAPEDQDYIFDKFYRGKSGAMKSGTGLGLSMVQSFITLHGGHVTIESEMDKGTIVHCYLPLNPFVEKEV